MNDKEKLIIENAIKLFSEKGYTHTSIQDIANECGIAKGSLYSYFRSKDALFLSALQFQLNQILKQVYDLREQVYHPRQRFIEQLILLFESVIRHKNFLDLDAYEQGKGINESIHVLIREKQKEIFRLYVGGLQTIYGKRVETYIYDVANLLDGMIRSYLRYLLHEQLNVREVIEFTMNRIDSLVYGLSSSQEKPLLSKLQHVCQKKKGADLNLVKERFGYIKESLKEQKGDHLITLSVIEEELARKEPRSPVLLGMLSNFSELKQVEQDVKEMKQILQRWSESGEKKQNATK